MITNLPTVLGKARKRLSSEGGWSLLFAIGALLFTTLLSAAIAQLVLGDVQPTQRTLDGQRAYDAAQAGLSAYLYQLNQNPSYYATCSNDVQAETAVPASTTGEQYSWTYVPANGNTTCTGSPPTPSLIDNGTGSLRMEFTGYSGNPSSKADPQVTRTIVASFRRQTPFDFLWYTVYEADDPALGSQFSGCGVFLRNNRSSTCNIVWVTGDVVNGPMYTEDQYLINGSDTPTFGRNANDKIESAAPGTSASDICGDSGSRGVTLDDCANANIKGTAVPNAPTISPPSSNAQLLTDATKFGKVYTGTTTITLNGGTATVVNCPTSTCTTSTITLGQSNVPIIYVQNGSGCTLNTYTPTDVSYPTTGCTGDVYVQGNYTSPLTIAAANNIIIDGSVTTTSSGGTLTGTATLGLIANEFIRVMHGVTYPDSSNGQYCDGNSTNISNETFSNITIDAAMMAVQHSFMVDNYSCGAQLGNLNVNGVVAQYYRGAVGTTGGTGYLKDYTYDDRLKALLPPYLFDITTADWDLQRETLCSGTSGAASC